MNRGKSCFDLNISVKKRKSGVQAEANFWGLINKLGIQEPARLEEILWHRLKLEREQYS